MQAFGETLEFGPYRLKAKIAEGGMAEVVLATSPRKEFQGQFLAIKKLLPHLNSNKAFVDLLIHEAKVGVLLNHPGIAAVYDLGSHKSEFFIAMEYVHGKSLDRILEKIKEQKAPKLPLEVSTYILLEVIRALSFAHQLKDSKGRELNIIHRDISPGNILLGYRGEVKLVDFGIATAESRLQQGFTQTAMGKLAYMAPEQAVNDPVIKASDIYSLGVVYYELLTGQLPFQAENANALLKKVIDGRSTDIRMVGPAISAGVRDIITQCLNKSSRKRYQSCPELFNTLVTHFKESLEIDFSARATRDYYKKKLAEYLRSCFEQEMIEELEIVQSALYDQAESEEHKVTAPQEVPKMKDGDFEATIFEADHTDEATRHYPLTEDERRKILLGLPPKQVIQRHAVNESESKPTKREVPAHAIFNLETIPEYDLAQESSSIKRISVKEKLETSSLDKENKETLKLQLPAQEITSQQELDQFEQSTFSGEEDNANKSTRPLNREQILKDFNEMKEVENNAEFMNDQAQSKWHPISSIKKAPTADRSPSRINKVSRETMAPRPTEPSNLVTWMVSIALTLVVGLAVYFALNFAPRWAGQFFVSHKSLTPTQTVALILTGEVSSEALRLSAANLRFSKTAANLDDVSTLFDRSYEKYTSQRAQTLKIQVSDEQSLIKGLTQQPQALQLINSNSIFDFLSPLGERWKLPYDAMIYLYVFPFDPQSTTNFDFPKEFQGTRDNRGIVFVPQHPSRQLEVMVTIAREIAFLYGAKDARDPNLGNPISPEGLANPKQEPAYPQTQAELMGRDIALSPLQKRPVDRFDQIVIGPYTAHQLGWITSDQLKEIAR